MPNDEPDPFHSTPDLHPARYQVTFSGDAEITPDPIYVEARNHVTVENGWLVALTPDGKVWLHLEALDVNTVTVTPLR